MSDPDLNLLITLDVLLAEGSVARAARRLRLSPSAMSRALARLREATGDPLLVRAGRSLVPTPRALALREQVGPLRREVEAVLRPAETLDVRRLARTFTLRVGEGFVENFGPALLRRVADEAPAVRLWFVPKLEKGSASLRDGTADLETGVVAGTTGPEIRAQALLRDRTIGVVRADHPMSVGDVTAARFAAGRHVVDWRHAAEPGPIEAALKALGLERRIVTVVAGFSSALALARATDLIATVPERYTGNMRDGLFSFPLPFATPEVTISLLWHPRLDGDPAHRWLRGCVREVCTGG